MVNIGIIGAGRIGKVHTKSIATKVDGAKVVAISDPFLNDEAIAWGKKYGVEKFSTDYNELLNDPAVDAIVICSPTTTHAEVSLAAIKAGKHVLCEKPISQDIAEIREIQEALQKTNLKYQVGFNRRFDHNFIAVKEVIDAGKIGDVHYVKITSRDPQAPPAEYVRSSGGMFMDMSVHDFDMAAYLTGSAVEEIYAVGANLVDPAIGEVGDIDTALVTLKMANGTMVGIDNSRQAVYGYDQRCEVFGSKGAVETKNDTLSTAVVSTVEGINSEKPLFFFLERYLDSYGVEAQAFVDAIINDTAVPIDIEAGLQPILIAIAGNLSMKENRPVKISEVR